MDHPVVKYSVLVLAILGGIMLVKATASSVQNNKFLRPVATTILRYG